MKLYAPLLCIFLMSFSAFSQQSNDTLTLPEQFDKIYRISSSYQEYKVIKKTRYQKLKSDVVDSIQSLRKEVRTKNQSIQVKNDSIRDIKQILEHLDTDLKQTISEKNSISIFGLYILKSTYNIIIWSVIILLLALLLYFVYMFKNSHIITKKAQDDLSELEEEFSVHKKKSLEREQKLRRQLQDEINKQRGV